jgi:hypothetical protein
MTRKLLFLITLFPLFSLLYSQSPLDEDLIQALFEGSCLAGNKMVSSLLTPRSTYREGEFIYSGRMGFSNIEQLSSDPNISCSSVQGYDLGTSLAYGLSSRWAVQGALSLSLMGGVSEGEFYSDLSKDVEADLSFFAIQSYLGASYIVFEQGRFSLPLTLGVLGSYYNFQADIESVSLSGNYEGTGSSSLYLTGFKPGLSAGVVAEYALSFVTLRANGAAMVSFGRLTGESNCTLTASDGSSTLYVGEYEISSQLGGTYGFSLELFPSNHWHFNLDISDFLPVLQEQDGFIDIYTLGLTVSYHP